MDRPDSLGEYRHRGLFGCGPRSCLCGVLAPFDINLALGSYPPGKYQLLLNGEAIGELNP